jgi:hypothetical protein
MRRTLGIGMGGFVLVALFGLQHLLDQRATAQRVPTYEVDPFWPKLSATLTLGQVAGVAVDAQDHVWILQRPGRSKLTRRLAIPKRNAAVPLLR